MSTMIVPEVAEHLDGDEVLVLTAPGADRLIPASRDRERAAIREETALSHGEGCASLASKRSDEVAAAPSVGHKPAANKSHRRLDRLRQPPNG